MTLVLAPLSHIPNPRIILHSLMASPKHRQLAKKASPSFRLRNPSLNVLRLRRIFDLFDHNADGLISPAELGLALDRLGLSSDPADISSLLSPFILPPDSPGLDFDAFQSLHRSLGDALFVGGEPIQEDGDEDDMREAFRVFDEDGDGFISAKELQAVLGKLGLEEAQSLDKVNAMIGSVDGNLDGRVDFGEFRTMMRTVVAQGS